MTTTVLPVQQVFSFIFQMGFCLEDFREICALRPCYLPGNTQQTARSSSLAEFKQLQISKLIAKMSCCVLRNRRAKGWKDSAAFSYHGPFPQNQSDRSCSRAGWRMRQQQPPRRGHRQGWSCRVSRANPRKSSDLLLHQQL